MRYWPFLLSVLLIAPVLGRPLENQLRIAVEQHQWQQAIEIVDQMIPEASPQEQQKLQRYRQQLLLRADHQTVPTTRELTSADDLLIQVQIGYAHKGYLRTEDPFHWFPGENVTAIIPTGWDLGFASDQGGFKIAEFVPIGQTISDWQDLLTLTINADASVSPQQMSEEMIELGGQICSGLDVSSVITGEENGYPFALWIQNCPKNPMTSRGEITLMKVIQGYDSSYSIQRAWRVSFVPADQTILMDPIELQTWGEYMALVEVCDTRYLGRLCP